jgi:hypothetical protein
LNFLIDTFNGKEQPKMQEDVAGRKDVEEEGTERRKQEVETQSKTV